MSEVIFSILALATLTSFKPHALLVVPMKMDTTYVDTINWNIQQTECKAVSMLVTKTYADSSEWERLSLNYYTRNGDRWQIRQHFDTLEGTEYGGELSLQDLNFDGVPDARLYYGTGARGSNECYYLFLSNPVTQRLELLNEGNLLVNPEIDSVNRLIETTAYSGSTYFERLRIEGNALVTVDTKEVWLEDSIAYQRKTVYLPNGKVQSETLDSVVNGEDYEYTGW